VIGFNFMVSTNISGEKSDIMKMEVTSSYAVLVLTYYTTFINFHNSVI
jgi:hypothetical protein